MSISHTYIGLGYIYIFSARAGHVIHGMAMTGFHKYVHTIRDTAKNIGSVSSGLFK